jgi:hypothetical protein
MALPRTCAIAYQGTLMNSFFRASSVSIRRLRFVLRPTTRTADNSVRMEVHAQKTGMGHANVQKVSPGLDALFRMA